jgi:TatD DNase family protein
MFTDSHTHLYLKAFSDDRDRMVQRALDAGVERMLLPNIDSHSVKAMMRLCDAYPSHCFPMMGLHPTSVKENYKEELAVIRGHVEEERIVAIGECGIDLYWEKKFLREQIEIFRTQIGWAKGLGLPLVIHARDSFQEIFQVLDEEYEKGLTGVFHSFTGGTGELKKALEYDFMIGINGIVTFKNSGLSEVAAAIPADRLLLETDAPFLSPVPHRGKRNESSYLVHVASKVAEIHNLSLEEVARITSRNAEKLFPKIQANG